MTRTIYKVIGYSYELAISISTLGVPMTFIVVFGLFILPKKSAEQLSIVFKVLSREI